MSKQRGIDVSYWQGNIDWKKVKADGIAFAVLREGYRQTQDKKFMDYVEGCRKCGIRIDGVYHFIYMMNDRITSNSETGRLNAESCLRNIQSAQLRKDEIIVWCDLEYDTVTHAKRTHNIALSNQDIKEITISFCNTIKKSGYRVGIYTNLDYAKNKYGLDFIKNFDVWLADYSGSADLDCLYHQYTSEGQVDGIGGKVDMNWKYTDEPQEGGSTTMGKTANDILNVARGWLGCNEGNGSHRKIIDLYNSVKPLPRGYAVKYSDEWCDTFVSACGIKAGCSDLIGRECGCEQHVKIFKNLGIWIEDGTITPRAGDIILYNWDTGVQPNNGHSDHIGIVESVNGYTITVIEGNMSERVGRRNIRVGHGNIRGYARPRYSNSGSAPVKPSVPSKSLTEVAKEVINGAWGNGADRKARLESAGYDFNVVQAEVNRILSGSSKPTLKPLSQVAKEVLRGDWGNGTDRKNRLESADYDYQAVQNEVNKIAGSSSVDIDKIARDVIKGKYGNGTTRRNALVQKFGASVADAVQRRVNQLL